MKKSSLAPARVKAPEPKPRTRPKTDSRLLTSQAPKTRALRTKVLVEDYGDATIV